MKRFIFLLILISSFGSPRFYHSLAQDTGSYHLDQTLGGGMVRSVAWSPKGDLLAVGGALGIWLYTPDLQPVGLLKGHTKAIYGLAFSPDGTELASASHDHTVRVWDVTAQTEKLKLEGHTDLTVAVAWSPDGKTLASGSYDRTVLLWNPATGELIRVLEGHTSGVNQVAFSPDGQQVISSALNGEIRTWNAATGQPQDVIAGSGAEWARLTGQPAETYLGSAAIQEERALSPDGTRWAVADWDNDVQLIDVATGKLLGENPEHADWIVWVGWNSDTVLAATLKNELSWSTISGDFLGINPVDPERLPPASATSPDGSRSFSIEDDGSTEIKDAAGQVIAELPGKANAAAWSEDGARLAVAQRNGTVQIWGTG